MFTVLKRLNEMKKNHVLFYMNHAIFSSAIFFAHFLKYLQQEEFEILMYPLFCFSSFNQLYPL